MNTMKVIGFKTVAAMVKAFRLERNVVTCDKCTEHTERGYCRMLHRDTSSFDYCSFGTPTATEVSERHRDMEDYEAIKAREDKEIMLGLDSPLDDCIKTIQETIGQCGEAVNRLREINHSPELKIVTEDWLAKKFMVETDE